jgi:Zn-dependent protease with chaperone function
MWIANPLRGKKSAAASMFSTHPPIEERIRRLNKMAGRIE